MHQVPAAPNSILRLILGVAGIVVILAGMQAGAPIVNLVLIAGLFTLLFIPMLHWLQRRGLGRRLALTFVILLVLLMGLALIGLVGVVAVGIADNVATYRQQLTQQSGELQQQLETRGVDASTFTSTVEAAGKLVLGIVADLATNIAGLLINAAFVLLIFAYLLAESDGFVRRMRRSVDADSVAFARAGQAVPSVVRFIAITAAINLVIAIGDTIFLWFLGIPHPVLWGVVAFVFGFIPYIGYWIALLPPLVLAFAQNGVVGAAVVLLGYWFINGVLSSVVAPRFYGKGLNVSPVLTLLAVLFWGWLLGPIGAVVGVPLTVLLKSIVLENYDSTRWLARVLSRDEVDDKPEPT